MQSKKLQVLALIPARAGSQRIKNKNVKKLGGKPLIAYTINAARESKLITRIVVSTDSPAIAHIARQLEAEVPFLRPKKISSGSSTEYEFHKHALDWLKIHEGYIPDLIVNLYPTSPFRTATSIDKAINIILKHPHADSLRSIKKCTEHPYKMWQWKDVNYIKPLIKKTNSASHTLSYQLLPPTYIQNASIYITRPRTMSKYRSTIGNRVIGFEMSAEESVDINTPIDFIVAEKILLGKKHAQG